MVRTIYIICTFFFRIFSFISLTFLLSLIIVLYLNKEYKKAYSILFNFILIQLVIFFANYLK